ncbi:MAG: NUDIX hydrolase [Candidatus Eiseniibacteriota bacterium]
MREAAVLVPLVEAEREPLSLVFIHRAKHGLHGDQIAFPGGGIEPGDRTPAAAALREFEEELGAGRDEVEVLETLPAMETRTTGYRVFPVLGRLHRLPVWSPDPREVAGALVVPVRDLVSPERRGKIELPFDIWNEPRSVPYVQAGRHRIWGLTYRILEVVLPRFAHGLDAPRP